MSVLICGWCRGFDIVWGVSLACFYLCCVVRFFIFCYFGCFLLFGWDFFAFCWFGLVCLASLCWGFFVVEIFVFFLLFRCFSVVVFLVCFCSVCVWVGCLLCLWIGWGLCGVGFWADVCLFSSI